MICARCGKLLGYNPHTWGDYIDWTSEEYRTEEHPLGLREWRCRTCVYHYFTKIEEEDLLFGMEDDTDAEELDVIATEGAPKVKATLSMSALAGLGAAEDEPAEESYVSVYMTAKAMTAAEVPENELAAMNNALADTGFEAGLYADLSFYKQPGEDEPTQVHELAGDGVNVEMEVPEDMQNVPEGYDRIFQTWTIHNGEAILLAEGTDTTQRFTSNGFSTFVIAYQDMPKAGK